MSPEQLLLVQHQAIKLVKSVSSITFEHWVQKEQFSELPRRCQESIRSIDLFAGPEDMFREACAHGTVNHIDANQIVTGSRLRTLGLHDVHIIQQGFSGLLRSSPGLRHLVLRDVTITSYNSSAELFTYLGVRNLEASLQQVWEHNSLTSAEYWCLLKHLPQLRKWMVLLYRDLLMRSVKGMDFEVVAFCPMLRSVDLDFLDPQSALLLLSRAFYMNRIKDCTMCICSMNEQLIQGLFLFNASLTSITITNDAVLGDDDDDDDDADPETIETDLDSTASRRFFLIPRSRLGFRRLHKRLSQFKKLDTIWLGTTDYILKATTTVTRH
ncbi:hypothetical protein BGX23_010789 [Mortierella sp. AD031]|nr:hypothetical protein BGX23_010789 [Mortierella sp. AD031]